MVAHRKIDSVAVMIHLQNPSVMKSKNGSVIMLNAQGQDQLPLLLATKREDNSSIKRDTLLHLRDVEISHHPHHTGVDSHLLLLLGSHTNSEDQVPARKDGTDMIPLLQEDEDMKHLMKKTLDPSHLSRGLLLCLAPRKEKRTLVDLSFKGDKCPAVPLLPPPLILVHKIGEERALTLALPLNMHLPLPHPQPEVETRRGMVKGSQNLVLQATIHQDKGLGPIPDPERGGEQVVIVAEGETIAFIVRVVLQDINKGATEVNHQEEIVGVEMEEGRILAAESKSERGEGLVETGEEESIALLPNLIKNEIEIERGEALVGIEKGEESAALLLNLIKNEIEIEREEAPVGIETGEESAAPLLNLIKNKIEIDRGEALVGIEKGEESAALLLNLIKNEIEIERGEAPVGIDKGEESAALLLNTIENVVIDMEKEEGGGALLGDHQTGIWGGAGEGGGAILATNVTKVCILRDIGLQIIMYVLTSKYRLVLYK